MDFWIFEFVPHVHQKNLDFLCRPVETSSKEGHADARK